MTVREKIAALQIVIGQGLLWGLFLHANRRFFSGLIFIAIGSVYVTLCIIYLIRSRLAIGVTVVFLSATFSQLLLAFSEICWA